METISPVIVLSEPDRNALERTVRMKTSEQRSVLRARIVLLAAAGEPDLEVARQLGVNRHTVRLWRQRFREQGLAGLEDAPGPGCRRRVYWVAGGGCRNAAGRR